MLIRSEMPADVDEIASVLTAAFDGRDGRVPIEVWLVGELRRDESWISSQSQVAVLGEVIVGHCLCTRAHVSGTPVLALGPIAVLPEWQGRGVGSALMRNAIETATGMGESLIGLVGDPRFYGSFGFVPGRDTGIEPPNSSWGPYFQVLRLPADRGIEGRFEYPAPFRALE